MYIYQQYATYFAQCPEELKDLAENELRDFGIVEIKESYCGFYFEASKEQLYFLTYNCRIINRILAPLTSYKVFSTEALYKCVYDMQWEDIISPTDTFAITVNVNTSKINHSHYAMQCMKDAIVDRLRDKFNSRPDIERYNPDVLLNLFITNNKATINMDIGGKSLHKRGYRKSSVKAPIQENLAAAFVQIAEWDGEQPLYDMFCGSGTIAFESALHYCRIPSAYLFKHFGFERLPDFDQSLWEQVRSSSEQNMRDLPPNLIFASDSDSEALKSLRTNLEVLPQLKNLHITQQDYQDIAQIKDSIIITNPPYGIRLELEKAQTLFAKDLGDFLKQRCTGSRAFIFFGNRPMIKYIGLRSKRKHIIESGGLDGRLVEYDLY